MHLIFVAECVVTNLQSQLPSTKREKSNKKVILSDMSFEYTILLEAQPVYSDGLMPDPRLGEEAYFVCAISTKICRVDDISCQRRLR